MDSRLQDIREEVVGLKWQDFSGYWWILDSPGGLPQQGPFYLETIIDGILLDEIRRKFVEEVFSSKFTRRTQLKLPFDQPVKRTQLELLFNQPREGPMSGRVVDDAEASHVPHLDEEDAPEMISLPEPGKFLIDSGLLFEFNRLLLHPLGLTLEIHHAKFVMLYLDRKPVLTAYIWDFREDPEGVSFGEGEPYESGLKRYMQFLAENLDRLKKRVEINGSLYQGLGVPIMSDYINRDHPEPRLEGGSELGGEKNLKGRSTGGGYAD